MFDQFCEKSPVTVMTRVAMEYALAPSWVNDLFERTAESQYTRNLTLSTLVDLMAPVVCGIHQSLRSSYIKSTAEIGASISAVYDKLARLETGVSETLVHESSERLAAIIDAMPAGRRTALLAGYRTKILDGNCLAATDHRIFELRSMAAAPLPGKSLVILDPERMLLVDLFACEDAYTQERSLLDRVLETVQSDDLWIADRHFCTSGFLRGLDQRGGSFVIRHHRSMTLEHSDSWQELGPSDTGYVMERPVRVLNNEGEWLSLRLVRVILSDKTRDGDEELLLLTNLPASSADAITVATLYHRRWLLETAFLHLTETLRCEINTLGYPKAALFGFSMAAISYNILAVTRAAMRSCHGQEKGDDQLSMHAIVDEIAGTYRGMEIALPSEQWVAFRSYSPRQIADKLTAWAEKVALRRFRKAVRGPKKEPPTKKYNKKQPHVSIKRVLNKRRPYNAP